MTRQNLGAPELTPDHERRQRGRRRRRGGVRRAAASPQPLPALGVCPTPDAVTAEALRLLATEQALVDMIRVLRPVAAVDPHAQPWLAGAHTLKRHARAELIALGFGPEGTVDAEDRVEIAGRVYRLPNQFEATARDLLQLTLARSATLTRQEISPMPTVTHDPNPTLNGTATPHESGLLTRALATARNALPNLRWPTLTEALVGAAVVVVAGGVYFACTAEVPTPEA